MIYVGTNLANICRATIPKIINISEWSPIKDINPMIATTIAPNLKCFLFITIWFSLTVCMAIAYSGSTCYWVNIDLSLAKQLHGA